MSDNIFGNNADPDPPAEEDDALLMRLEAIEEYDDAAAADEDRFSFEDSERFEEDSLCSLPSENGSLNHKWRGWAPKSSSTSAFPALSSDPSTSVYSASAQAQSSPIPLVSNNGLSGSDGDKCMSMERPDELSIRKTFNPPKIASLSEMAAKTVAATMSFEAIESTYAAVFGRVQLPEKEVFIQILKYCFPQSEKDICLYSCLANTHANEFADGEHLYQLGAVSELFQIGYHISAVVVVPDDLGTPKVTNGRDAVEQQSGMLSRHPKSLSYNVSIKVDRCRITFCKCSCSESVSWCQHVVAVCLQRIYKIDSVKFRPTIWDSITRLSDKPLQKLAQYLVSELPREYLPIAQKLIDELEDPMSDISRTTGAPDPTVDGHDNGMSALWCMNEKVLHDNIYKILINFVKPTPTVHCDVQYLSASAPPSSSEWNNLIRPLRSREPEALWNLLSIVREMLKRGDENASTLLHVITEDCLRMDQILIWWYQTTLLRSGFWFSLAKVGGGGAVGKGGHTVHSPVNSTQYNAASLCDEIVCLWRLVALNPKLSSFERDQFSSLLQLYHRSAVHRIWRTIEVLSMDNFYSQNIIDENGYRLSVENASFTERHFPGFFPALQACHIDWHGAAILRIVGELNFTRLNEILQQHNYEESHIMTMMPTTSSSYGDVNYGGFSFPPPIDEPAPIGRECRNIPLLRYNAHLLAASSGAVGDVGADQPLIYGATGGRLLADSGQITAFSDFQGSLMPGSSCWLYDGGAASAAPRGKRSSGRRSKKTKASRSRRHQQQHQVQQLRHMRVLDSLRQPSFLQQHYRRYGSANGAPPAVDYLEDSIQEDVDDDLDAPSSSTLRQQRADQQRGGQLSSQTSGTCSRTTKNGEPYSSQLDTLFASAHCELNAFVARFVCCEALVSHGYNEEALVLARLLAQQLLKNPPNAFADTEAVAASAAITTSKCQQMILSLSLGDSEDGEASSGGSAGLKAAAGSLKGGAQYLFCRRHCAYGCASCGASGSGYSQSAGSSRGGGGRSAAGGCDPVPLSARQVPPNLECLKASELVATTLRHTVFLVQTLLSDSSARGAPSTSRLIIELSLSILRNPRGPAATKSLEVYIFHLENELLELLRRIELGDAEVSFIRGFARDYLRGMRQASSNRITVPPTTMAHYILDVLSQPLPSANSVTAATQQQQPLSSGRYLPSAASSAHGGVGDSTEYDGGGGVHLAHLSRRGDRTTLTNRRYFTSAEDDELALAVALETIGMRVFVSEADHPMLCECIRRQRADLWLALLVRNRDCIRRVGMILDKVLDVAVHRMYIFSDHPSNAAFFLCQVENLLSIATSSRELVDGNGTNAVQLQGGGDTSSPPCFRGSPSPKKNKESRKPSSSASSDEGAPVEKMASTSLSASPPSAGGGGTSDDPSSTATTTTTMPSASLLDFDDDCGSFYEEKHGDLHRCGKTSRRNNNQFLSNRATEAQAHFMFEFSRRLLTEAGGTQSSTMFNSLSSGGGMVGVGGGGANSGNGGGAPHRNLHICSFLVGLYALGLNNLVSSTWPTRTYSTHGSWLQTQALEIGRCGLQIVRKTWEAHLTPSEVASLADKASQSADPLVVEEGAQLALAILAKAYALTPLEVKRALNQCKDQGGRMLEQACITIEESLESDGVSPDVLFEVAHQWCDLHVESVERRRRCGGREDSVAGSNVVAVTEPSSTSGPSSFSDHGPDTPTVFVPPQPMVSRVQFTSPTTLRQQMNYNNSRAAAFAGGGRAAVNEYTVPPPSFYHHRHPYQLQQVLPPPNSNQSPIVSIPIAHPPPNGYLPHQMGVANPHSVHQPIPLQITAQNALQQQQPPNVTTQQHPHQIVPHHHYASFSSTSATAGVAPVSSSVGADASARIHASHSAPNLQPVPPPPHHATSRYHQHGFNEYQQQLVALKQYYPNQHHHQHQSPYQPHMHPYHYSCVTQPVPLSSTPAQQPPSLQVAPPPPPTSMYYGGPPPPAGPLSIFTPPPQLIGQPNNRHFLNGGGHQPHYNGSGGGHAHHHGNGGTNMATTTSSTNSNNNPLILSPQSLYNQQLQQRALMYSVVQQQQVMRKPPPPATPFLINAHRVGMRALDTMGVRNSDDCRNYAKYSRNPLYCDEIHWLLEDVSMRLGDAYVNLFLEKAAVSIASPYLLLYLVKESIKYFNLPLPATPAAIFDVCMSTSGERQPATPVTTSTAGNDVSLSSINASSGGVAQPSLGGGPNAPPMNSLIKSYGAQAKNLMAQHAYPHAVAEVMRHCVEMCYASVFNKLSHSSSSRHSDGDIHDACQLILLAREAFTLVPQNGKSMFETFLRFARRQKSCKKDVVAQINAALAEHQNRSHHEQQMSNSVNNNGSGGSLLLVGLE